MAIHAAAPRPSLSPQRSPISDPALAQALPRKQTDRDLGLVQPTAVLGGVVHPKPIPQPASGLLAKAFHHRLAGVRTQIVQHHMDGIRLRVTDRDLQQVVGKLRRGAVGRHLGEVASGFGLHPTKHIGSTATFVFAVAPRDSSRTHGLGRTNLLVEHHRFLVHTNHRFPLTQRLFVHRQDVLHAPDIFLIQFRHAPHFFPATASGRGFPARPGWFHGPLAEPVCVSPPLRSAGAPSNALDLPAVDHRLALRCVADAVHPARPLSPAGAARREPAPIRLADSVGWSATPSSELRPHSSLLGGWFDPRPVVAGPKLAAPSARAANRSAASVLTPAVPAWTAEPQIASSCPSYRPGHVFQQVSICITIYAVAVLVPHRLDRPIGRRDCRPQCPSEFPMDRRQRPLSPMPYYRGSWQRLSPHTQRCCRLRPVAEGSVTLRRLCSRYQKPLPAFCP